MPRANPIGYGVDAVEQRPVLLLPSGSWVHAGSPCQGENQALLIARKKLIEERTENVGTDKNH